MEVGWGRGWKEMDIGVMLRDPLSDDEERGYSAVMVLGVHSGKHTGQKLI